MNDDVKAYLDSVPESRAAHVHALHELILELFPDAVVDMRYKMPTYQVGDGWVAVANQKSYVSLYTCGAAHLAAFKEKHPQYRTGKGCINFRERDTLPLPALRAVIRHAIRHPKGPAR